MLLDFSNWNVYDGASEGSGRSEKIWLQNPETGQIGLFKLKKDKETTDHVSEHMAYQIANLLNIPCAKFELGTYQNNEGSISYNMITNPNISLVEGVSFISEQYPFYDPEKFLDVENQKRYSPEMLEPIMEYLKDKYYDKAYPHVQIIEAKITDDKISDILEQYTENLLPTNKKLIIQRFLHDKVQILREIFRKEE